MQNGINYKTYNYMKVQYLLKNMTEHFYNRVEEFTDLDALRKYLENDCMIMPQIPASLRDCAEVNMAKKAGKVTMSKDFVIRRGYRLLNINYTINN